MFDFPLKKHSTEEIQATIAKALSELCGAEVDVRIHEMNFGNGVAFSTTTKMSLSIDRPSTKTEDKPF
ncbi:hypothetical protein ACH58_07550 [Achromobacter xylosoxidans]|uniref:hypothetical protein n=1 Tax=Achromobacter TaxID=222 RepID=UPI00064DAFBA|nr:MULTISPECIES: hypothetical protein [Achromobacter]KMJ92472.1 hypothetical protein ACH58_07550 [Achromobacter xylosoxidans]CAB3647458.1 hypothetical protein LMG26696_02605 [Achromobacter pulmonis]